MSSGKQPISPNTSRRVIDVEPAVSTEAGTGKASNKQSSFASSAKASVNPDKPLKLKGGFFSWLDNFSMKKFLLKSMLILVAFVVLMAIYISWSSKESKWQVEHINHLQTDVSNLKTKLKELAQKQQDTQEKLNNLVSNQVVPALAIAPTKGASRPESKLAKQSVEALDESEVRVSPVIKPLFAKKALADQMQQVEAEIKALQEALTGVVQRLNKQLALAPSNSHYVKTDVSENFVVELKVLKDSQAALQEQFQVWSQKIETALLASQAANEALKSEKKVVIDSINGLTKLSPMEVQTWVLQINNQWLFVGNKALTINSLQALLQTLMLSELPNKMNIINDIHKDLTHLDQMSTAQAHDTLVIAVSSWLKQLKISPVSPKVSRETTEKSLAEGAPNTMSDSVWSKIKERFSTLFTVRKRASQEDLSDVARELQVGLVKQRILLQSEQLSWALNSGNFVVAKQSMENLTTLIEQYAPAETLAWQSFQKQIASVLADKTNQVRQPLFITGAK